MALSGARLRAIPEGFVMFSGSASPPPEQPDKIKAGSAESSASLRN
jgi:hypothetical protein